MKFNNNVLGKLIFESHAKLKPNILLLHQVRQITQVSTPFFFMSTSSWTSEKHSVASILSSTPVQYMAGHEKTVGPVANPITVQVRTQHSP